MGKIQQLNNLVFVLGFLLFYSNLMKVIGEFLYLFGTLSLILFKVIQPPRFLKYGLVFLNVITLVFNK